nr:MAG TPA: hypothetical protein [Caudoviricetes sp.]
MTLALSIGEDLIITFQPSLDSAVYSCFLTVAL